MLSTHPVNHFSQVLAVVVMGLACVSVAGKGHAAKADMDEATVMSNYRAAMANGDETAAVKYLLDFTEETRGENAPATAKLTYRYGYLLYRDGEYREATDVLKKALECSTVAFGESGGEAFEINMNIGYAMSRWSPSISRRTKYFDRALEILRERGEHESIKYVTTLVNIVVNLMDNDGLSGDYSSALGDDYERYNEGEVSSYTPEREYSNYFDRAERYVLEAAELSKKLESQDEYLSSKIAIAQAKLNVMATADLAAVPAGVRGRITSSTAKERNELEEERLISAIDKLSEDIDNNKVFLAAANKALMEIAWLDKDGERMLAMCTDGILNSASEYHPDRLYAIAEDGSVLAPNFSFKVTSNIFRPVVRRGDEPTDRNGNPIRKPYFIPVCIDGRLMAALINAPTVTIEEFY